MRESPIAAAIAMAAIVFLWWAFGWKAAIGWLLIQTYANLRADTTRRSDGTPTDQA